MKLIKVIYIYFIFCTLNVVAQSSDTVPVAIDKVEKTDKAEEQKEEYHAKDLQHQIYLEEPVKSLDDLEYEKDGEKLKGKLSDDGKRVIIENYHKRGRLKVVVTLPNGEQKTISKSSCFVDIVIPM